MFDLKKYNYFTGDINCVRRGVADIVNFFDLAGRNYLMFTPPKISHHEKLNDLCLYHYLENKIDFLDIQDFSEKIADESNLFRVDLLVFDFWSIPKNELSSYILKIQKLQVDFIIVAKEYHYKTSDDVNDFLIRTEYKDLHKSDIWIHDKINGIQATIDSLRLAYIRDKKIEHLFENKLK